MKNESVKKSLEKSQNVLEAKRKMVKRKICMTNTFTIIAMNFVQEQFKNKPTNVGRITLERQAGAKTFDPHRDTNHWPPAL